MSRTFTDQDAAEARAGKTLPLLIGLAGPSSSGKTYSALRIATGIQSVVGGEIFGVDTESDRMLHFADKFKFRHVPFGEPFSSLDYLDVLRHCKARGAGVVVVDSVSHEHDGPGGMLEQHEAELDRMAGNDYKKRDRVSIGAWAKPKAKRRKLVTEITTELNMPVIFCWRAKSSTKPNPGQQPIDMGYTAIGAEEWKFEMTFTALMLPGAKGFPTWRSDKPGERLSMKMVEQFEWLEDYGQLDERVGVRAAEWARGSNPAESAAVPAVDPAIAWTEARIASIQTAADTDTLDTLYGQAKTKLAQKPELMERVTEAHRVRVNALSEAQP